MQAPDPKLDMDHFFARVGAAPTRVLMLDYDGTLAPFHVDPAQARPYPHVVPLLDAIMDTGDTRLVIVSGRWIKDLTPMLGLKRLPELWGSHGWERLRPSGDYRTPLIQPQALALLVAVDDWIGEFEACGARAERKPASVAFHWRGLPDDHVHGIREALFQKWARLSPTDDLVWHDFDGGIELRAAGHHKGDVVRALAAEAGPHAALAYLGDDLTDEDAFKAMPNHGAAILVKEQFRPTAADFWIRPPGELIALLRRWHEATRSAR